MKALTVVPLRPRRRLGRRPAQIRVLPPRQQPAEFRFFSSTTRKDDQPGDLLDPIPPGVEELAPMEVTLSGAPARVSLEAQVTETGMLEIYCVAAAADNAGSSNSTYAHEDRYRPRHHQLRPRLLGPSSEDAAISVFEIPQFTAPGRLGKLRAPPSFLYLADQTYVGAYAANRAPSPHPLRPLGQKLALQPRRRPLGQNPPLGSPA
jgi:hypothetical protein